MTKDKNDTEDDKAETQGAASTQSDNNQPKSANSDQPSRSDTNASQDDDKNEGDDIIRVARTPSSPALQTQLEQSRMFNEARGLGAGRTGSTLFYLQRLTAVALVPLSIWFVVGVVSMTRGAQADAAAWLGWPVNAVLMGLFIVIALRHSVIGIRIICEDYINDERLRGACMLVVEAIALLIGAGAVAALVHLALL